MWSEVLAVVINYHLAIVFALLILAFFTRMFIYSSLVVFVVYAACGFTNKYRFESENVFLIYYSFTAVMCILGVYLIEARAFISARLLRSKYKIVRSLFKSEESPVEDFTLEVIFVVAASFAIFKFVDYWYLPEFKMVGLYKNTMMLLDILVIGVLFYSHRKKMNLSSIREGLRNGTLRFSIFASALASRINSSHK